MTPSERVTEIQKRLSEKFPDGKIEVVDDSAKHIGHAGSRDGAGHYTVNISAASLLHQSRIEAHKQIYALLADLIPNEIHALQIKIIAGRE